MRAMKIKKILMLFFSLALIASCVEDEFTTPDVTITEPQLDGPVITLDALFGEYEQEFIDFLDDLGLDINNPGDADEIADAREDFVYALQDDNQNYVSGYVISSDEAGNFFEELILQDRAENPTVGIKLIIDENPLYTRYEMGRKIYVKLGGLAVGQSNGVLTLGMLSGNEVDQIPGPQETDFIQRSSEVATLIPLPLTLDALDDSLTNLYIELQDVQFSRSQVLIANPLTFAAEPTDEFDGERILEDCAAGVSAVFSTSTFADFKALELPTQRGSMRAILSKNFFGDTFNIVVNSASDITFENAERCDPDILECDGPGNGSTTIWSEDFEGFAGFDNEGWVNVNTSGGNEDWSIDDFAGNNYAIANAFNSGEQNIMAWLVTPAINLDGTTDENLSFEVQTNFNNGDVLTALITDNFTGDVTTTDWEQLDVIIPAGNPSGFGNFELVGPTNISCLSGDIHIAFLYEGSDPGPTTRYHVDNIEVNGN